MPPGKSISSPLASADLDMKNISGKEAAEILRSTGRLENMHVVGMLNMFDVTEVVGKNISDTVERPLRLKDCRIENYYSPCLLYGHKVLWEKCTFVEADLYAAYFY